MQLENFYREENRQVIFTRDQASRFAKRVADDFNPLHDPEAKLFCVPGDLLFSVALKKYGVSNRMRFSFAGMVDGETPLHFPAPAAGRLTIADDAGKEYLHVERSGECSTDPLLIANLTRSYVEFSGHTFPHILVPLMAEHGVMINPGRPLVIYESMEIDLDRVDLTAPSLEYTGATLEVNGKKGAVSLNFRLRDGEEPIGRGAKYMLLRGLQAYDKQTVEQMVEGYFARKGAFTD